ncbi:protein sneaky [Schistocerca gregaria]|uniref:protein sneaky n=1 Tax=Schistocerca gregaria TaxID=7010 RepID=UPI00211F3EF7|nr:protein sneaky [Schistocerca gregaria]
MVVMSFLPNGLRFATGLWYLTVSDLGGGGGVAGATAASVMMGVAAAVSRQMRCVCALCLPGACGRAGLDVLRVALLCWAVEGPLQGMAYSAGELARTFSCSAALAYNLTSTRVHLMVAPFQQALLSTKVDTSEARRALGSVRGVVEPLRAELEGGVVPLEHNDYLDELQKRPKRSADSGESPHDAGTSVETKYAERLAGRCRQQLERGADRCRGMFQGAYDRCYRTVSWIAAWLLCWPMKLTFFCNIAQALGGDRCAEASSVVPAGLGDGYSALQRSGRALTSGAGDVKVTYSVRAIPEEVTRSLPFYDNNLATTSNSRLRAFSCVAGSPEYVSDGRRAQVREEAAAAARGAADAAQDAAQEARRSRSFLQQLTHAARLVARLLLLRVLTSAQNYHERYLADVRWDNWRVTPYFRLVDARRRAKGRQPLLPLRPVEKTRMHPRSSPQLVRRTFMLLLEVLAMSVLVLMDRLMYEILSLISRHALIHYTQTGSHDMSIEVKGTGLIAKIVRSIVKGFNIKKRVKYFTSNEACLPVPKKPNIYIICKIYGTYFAMWVIILVSSYIYRFQSVICAYFYPKQEKRRILFLYNETLKTRAGILQHMKATIKHQARIKQMEVSQCNILTVMRIRYPKYCSWLQIFPAARRRCMICQQKESRPRKGPSFIYCTTPNCYTVHCPDCWNDVGNVCFACYYLSGSASSSNSDDDTHVHGNAEMDSDD